MAAKGRSKPSKIPAASSGKAAKSSPSWWSSSEAQRRPGPKRLTSSRPSKPPATHSFLPFGICQSLPVGKLALGVVFIPLASLVLLQYPEFLRKSWHYLFLYTGHSPLTGGDELGGWRPASENILAKYGSDVCHIERVSVSELSPERFESEFRFKKPVIITFPNGAGDWTDPVKWSREGLVKAYREWTIRSGQSLDIVRKGGNAKHSSSFSEFIDKLMADSANETSDPQHYAFDRRFYWNSDLPQTLRLPTYLQVNTSAEESIFFLGGSRTGVVFHKHSDTWNGVVYGRKRWFFYPTTKTPPGGVHHGFSLLDWVENVYPNLTENNKPMECVQQPGEILYLMEGTYHATLNLGDTVAVAIQRRAPTLEGEILSYEATKLVNIIQDKEKLDPKDANLVRLLEVYKKWHEILPESAEPVMKAGDTLLQMERYAESIPWHMKAIKMEPYFILAYLNLAKAFSKLRQYERAEITFKETISLSPNLWDSYKEYGEFLLKQGRPADALPIYKRGTELMPDLIAFWFYYKQCQLETGDVNGASETEKVLVHLRAMNNPEG